uniref:Putative ovule protein n=1 Tax=Solanum chacoense TaxID=4108 RepID=A0A0V0HDS4_SOLCH
MWLLKQVSASGKQNHVQHKASSILLLSSLWQLCLNYSFYVLPDSYTTQKTNPSAVVTDEGTYEAIRRQGFFSL